VRGPLGNLAHYEDACRLRVDITTRQIRFWLRSAFWRIALTNGKILVSLVVSTLGRTASLKALFESLAGQDYRNFELIIVDQNDDDRLKPLFGTKTWPFTLRRIHAPGQRGLSLGRNTGWIQAEGSIVAFPDDDCLYPPWLISRALGKIAETGADVLAGRAADENGQSINGRFERDAQWIDRTNVWTTGIEWVVFFKRSALLAVGGYNTNIGVGASTPWQACEGQDIMLRAMAAGLKCFYDPSLYGHHEEMNIYNPDAPICRKGRMYGRGMGHVLRIHGYGLGSSLKLVSFPTIKGLFFLFRCNIRRFLYYRNVALGRFEGWSGRLYESI
jgi:glycosyltransferase involved in cell wall biosynthesis